MSPRQIAKHSFYPFIDYQIISEKLAIDSTTNKLYPKRKERPIAYASHVDSHIYSYYAWRLGRLYEVELKNSGIQDSILAFRSLGKCNIEFANQVFNDILGMGECGVVALDITGFFNNLDHALLKKSWASLLSRSNLSSDHYAVFKSITAYSLVDRTSLYKLFDISVHNPKNGRHRVCEPSEFRNTVRAKGHVKVNKDKYGIPQGSPISALLSNIYMLNFDKQMCALVTNIGGKYYRYCDDMLFIVPISKQSSIAGDARRAIKDLRIDINTEKTEMRQFKRKDGVLQANRPLQYLGFMFDGNTKIIRSAALARYSDRMKRGVRLAKLTRIKYNRLRIEKGGARKDTYRRKLYERYSHLGQRNFIRYGLRAAQIMNSKAIRSQIKPLWNRLTEELKK